RFLWVRRVGSLPGALSPGGGSLPRRLSAGKRARRTTNGRESWGTFPTCPAEARWKRAPRFRPFVDVTQIRKGASAASAAAAATMMAPPVVLVVATARAGFAATGAGTAATAANVAARDDVAAMPRMAFHHRALLGAVFRGTVLRRSFVRIAPNAVGRL